MPFIKTLDSQIDLSIAAMSDKRVAVVTGANKGIGKAIVKALCKQFSGSVILTARDEGRGRATVAELQTEGLSPLFHELDINSSPSVERLRDHLIENFGGLDILVNNAGVAFDDDKPVPIKEKAEVTCRTNYFGTLNVSTVLSPILRPHARVVNISSMNAIWALEKTGAELKTRWRDATTEEQCTALIREFVSCAATGAHREKGWTDEGYDVSKIGITALATIQQATFDHDEREDIIVNSCCPGYVATDMTRYKGPLTVDEGADTPVYLALLPLNSRSPRGEFVSNRSVIDWKSA